MATAPHSRRRPSRHTSFLRRHREGFESRGLRGTLRLAAGYASQLAFDLRHRVDTRGTLYHLQEHDSWRHARAYQPVGHRSFARPLDALGVDPSRFAFVDLGCGKGKALILASQAGFARVFGVELSPVLAAAARENVRRARVDAEVHTEDAARFAYPDGPLVVYTYHSFDEPILRGALDRLGAALRAQPREAYVVYVQPDLAHVLDEMAFLRPFATGPHFAIYAAAPA